MNKEVLVAAVNQSGQVLQQVYTDLAQPGVRKVGLALETVLELSNTILLPLKLVNERSKLIFQKNMNNYQKKIESVPENDIVPVPPELGIPIIEKFTYVTNEEISELFSRLLATASNSKTAHLGHPGFIRIIENLSVDEAKIIEFLINSPGPIPHVSIRIADKNHSYKIATTNMTGIEKKLNLTFPDNDGLYLDNLVSLGILHLYTDKTVSNKQLYLDLEEIYSFMRDEVVEKYKDDENTENVYFHHGAYDITTFGYSFFESISNT
jgi:hypothetical protein